MWYHIHDACYELTGLSPPWGGSSLTLLSKNGQQKRASIFRTLSQKDIRFYRAFSCFR